MFNWIKKLFGYSDTEVKEETAKNDAFPFPTAETSEKSWPDAIQTEQPVKKTKTKKAPKTKKETVDYSTMNKKQLLDLCKTRGIKANASLKREEIVERLQK